MRKPAPALILTTLIAFASGSAMALGDRAKEKKASNPQSMTQPAASANVTTPGSNPSPSAVPKATTDGSAASPPPTPASAAGPSASAPSSTMAVTTDGGTSKPDMSKMKKDGKCDEAKYPNKAAMPQECAEKVSPGK
jgi:hypothetical protein